MNDNIINIISDLKKSYFVYIQDNFDIYNIKLLIEKLEKNINFFPIDKIARWIGFCFGVLNNVKNLKQELKLPQINNDNFSSYLFLINQDISNYCINKTNSLFLKVFIEKENENISKTEFNYSVFIGFIQFLLIDNEDTTVIEERDRTRPIFQEYYKQFYVNFYQNYYLNKTKEF